MFFSAEPRHCDLELLVPYLAALSSPSMSMSATTGHRSSAASAAAAAAPARARCSRPQQPLPAQPSHQKQRENLFEGGAAPSSPQRAAPARPAEKKVPAPPSTVSPSAVPIVHHRPPSAPSGAHLFSVDLPGRSLSSFDIDVEERDGTGRLFIDAAAVERGGDSRNLSSFVPRKALHLSLDLPRDADLSRVSADYDAGVLLLRVPLVTKEETRRFKIVIGGGGGVGKGGKRKVDKGEEKEVVKEEVEAASPSSPSSPSPPPPASLGAVAAADLSRASLGEKNGDDDEDGSWKAVSSDNDDDDFDKNQKNSSTPSTERSNNRKAPSGGAVLEAIDDDAEA